MTTVSTSLASTPITQRPKPDLFRLIAFNIWFITLCACVHGLQLLFTPLLILKYYPLPSRYKELNDNLLEINAAALRLAKRGFAVTLALCSEWWGRTEVVLSADEGFGLEEKLVRNEEGEVKGVRLPDRMIMISNHQIYADWVYLWWLLLLGNLHDSVTITLKASLQYLPILGPGMKLFNFIFLARNWAKDEGVLTRRLKELANGSNWLAGGEGEQSYNKLTFLIFPEGALTEEANRVKSEKWAKKIGVEDMKHSLLPRATGFFHSLRALKAKISDLDVLDVTVGYEGIPKGAYGQDYYTLQSIFGAGIPPPRIHMHLRLLSPPAIPESSEKAETEKSQKQFEDWLVQTWREKDEMLEVFYNTQELSQGPKTLIPLETLSWNDWKDLAWTVAGGFITAVISWRFALWAWWFVRNVLLFWW
ncbi:acyltransferase-domain-containing protein [Atractiella rhizophila]|nr:acyltransferase-domain-containing protein [Atractiella rhizophila]